jgi:hypothetical protein
VFYQLRAVSVLGVPQFLGELDLQFMQEPLESVVLWVSLSHKITPSGNDQSHVQITGLFFSFFFFFFPPVLGFKLRAYHLSHSTSPFFVLGFF